MKILFLADGTANGPGEVDSGGAPDPTNVFKLFLRLSPQRSQSPIAELESVATDANGIPIQKAKYVDGVGVDGNPAQVLMGQAAGSGLVTRIVRGYTYLSRTYRDGDELFLVGFSRGAYTVRALAGMIVRHGLLDPARYDPNDREAAYRLAAGAWYQYQRTISANHGALGDFEKFALEIPGIFDTASIHYRPVTHIEAVGVWDTVGSFMTSAIFDAAGGTGDLFPLANTQLSKTVTNGYQAVSLDEQRDTFQPVLWDAPENVEQCLFPGVHADIGGGYSIARGEAELSDITLDWMTHRLQQHGVLIFSNSIFGHSPNPTGIAHQQWRYPPWATMRFGHAPRRFANRPDLMIHPAVRQRERAPKVTFDPGGRILLDSLPPIVAPYRPLNLP